jgi:hypothetical protein
MRTWPVPSELDPPRVEGLVLRELDAWRVEARVEHLQSIVGQTDNQPDKRVSCWGCSA